MKGYKKNKSAITIVELIVVITILAILGVISFISVGSYIKSSRDAVRISDTGLIKKGLELNYIYSSHYIEPHGAVNIVAFSGATVWKQGTFGATSRRQIKEINSVPTDPLTLNEYTFSITPNGEKYELGIMLEGDGGLAYSQGTILGETYANRGAFERSYISGNYNGKVVKTSTGGIDYVFAMPSIISSDIADTSLDSLISNNKIVIDNYDKMPHSYGVIDTNPYDSAIINIDDILIFSGSTKDLADDSIKRLDVLLNIQKAYSGTLLSKKGTIKEYMDVIIDTENPSDLSLKLANENVLYNIGVDLDEEGMTQIESYEVAEISDPAGINSINKWGWGNNLGWINFLADDSNIIVSVNTITGSAWTQNHGWMNFSPDGSGVTNTCNGVLGGSAWIENIGWISMDGITIDSDGYFKGIASDSLGGSIVFSGDNFSLQTEWRPGCGE